MKAAELTAAIPKIRVVDADTRRVYEGYYCEMPETTYCMQGPPIKTVRMILTYTMTDWGLPNTPKLYRIDDEDDVEIIQAEPPKEENKMKETIIRQYRKKPVIVEAVQLDNINAPCVVRWIGEDKAKMNLESDAAYQVGKAPPVFSVTIKTLEGDMKAMPGDYIIKGINGEFYPCKPDIFEKTYEVAE